MQILPAGSFINLDSAEKVEALKFTACRLAEHTAQAVSNELNAASLENLTNQLWEKAEYVMRETERRRLHQLFNENFRERFRELKPEAAEVQESEQSALPASETADSGDQEFAAAGENSSLSVSPETFAPAVEGKNDEFLGFVEPGEPHRDMQGEEANATATAAFDEPAPAATAAQVEDKLTSEPLNAQEQSFPAHETLNPVNQPADTGAVSEPPPPIENSSAAKTEAIGIAAPAEIKSAKMPVAAAVAATGAVKTSSNNFEAKEPFEFEKCTINLNLTLLPAEPGRNTRKVIVGTVSHNLPPEIDFLEIPAGEDLTEISGLVLDKLARFIQTLPAKYIEQLRAAKTKQAKKPEAMKNTTAAATATVATSQPPIDQQTAEKMSGEQKGGEATEAKAEARVTPPVPSAPQPIAPNNIQGSLF